MQLEMAVWISDFMDGLLTNPPAHLSVTKRMNGKHPGLAVKDERRLILDFYQHDDYIRGGIRQLAPGMEAALRKFPGVELSHPPRAKYTTIYVRSAEGLNAIRLLIGLPTQTAVPSHLTATTEPVQPSILQPSPPVMTFPRAASSGDLFSPLPAQRLASAHVANPQQSLELPAHWREQVRDWPMFSAGALNAWLLFVGVSPGNSTRDGVDLSAEHWLPTLGVRHPHAGHYCDDAGFWNKVRALTNETLTPFLPSSADPLESFMVANLARDLNAAPNAADVERAVGGGAAHLKRVLLLTQARLVCVMNKPATPKLIEKVSAWGWQCSSQGVVDVGSRARAEYWRVAAPYGTVLVTQTGQHPSMYVPAKLSVHLRGLAERLIQQRSGRKSGER
ncbi:MAG TPA: hypothetical protein VGP72_00490 [Planctomycetota bacterium]|jgi:hypothetical protein